MTRRELRGRGARAGGNAGSGAALDGTDAGDEAFEDAAPDDAALDDAAIKNFSLGGVAFDDAAYEDAEVGRMDFGGTPVEDAEREDAEREDDEGEDAEGEDAEREDVESEDADAEVDAADRHTWPQGLAFPPTRSWESAGGSPFPPVGAPNRRTSAWSFEPAAHAAEPATDFPPDEATDRPPAAEALAPDAPAADALAAEPSRAEPSSAEPSTAETSAEPGQPGAWDLAVGWSLRHELPRELPPEPEVEDVRWETVETAPLTSSARPDELEAPAGAPVDRPADEVDELVSRSGAPVSRPVVEHADTTATTEIDLALLEPPDLTEAAHPGTPAETEGASRAHTSHLEPPPGPFLATMGPAAQATGGSTALPTLQDLLAARPIAPAGPAEAGWRGTVRRVTGGLIAPAPGRAEQVRRAAVSVVQRSLIGPKTVVVINPKGGAHKTTATLLLAATFGQHRGGYTLAWDNNETRGTLGWRSHQSRHHNTAVNLLQDLERFSDPRAARVGDLDNYVRSQGSGQFDVLASDEDAASAASIDAFAFRSLHRTLSRFYRIMVIDTGNNMRASNWQAAIEAADQVVLVSTVREDTAQSAAWAVDALRATGHEDKVRQAVTVLSAPSERRDDRLAARLHEHFGRLTRQVLDVPYDPSLVAGKPLEVGALSDRTREAWLGITAAVAEGL